ncbi:hypothetical protein CRUP_023058, partial [Coryphaenoides rupestris]
MVLGTTLNCAACEAWGTTEDSRDLPQLSNQNTGQTGCELPLAAEAVAPLNETDEQTENSSDEENLPSGTHDPVITIPSAVAPLNETDEQTENSSDEENLPSGTHDPVITIPSDDDDIDIETLEDKRPPAEDWRSLRSTLDSDARTRLQILNEASNEICNLEKDQWRLRKVKKALEHQHNALVKRISTIS